MSSGFVTESEILEERKKREEEWERVLKTNPGLAPPEVSHDSRSLFDRLQEQKQKKDLEFEEAHKLKNMVKGLDDEEVEFLNLVDRSKLAAQKHEIVEEERELVDYRNRVVTLQEENLDRKTKVTDNAKLKSPAALKNSQTKLLKKAVIVKSKVMKRKSTDVEKTMDSTADSVQQKKSKFAEKCTNIDDDNKDTSNVSESVTSNLDEKHRRERCTETLPGLGSYDASSSYSSSSNSESEACEKSEV